MCGSTYITFLKEEMFQSGEQFSGGQQQEEHKHDLKRGARKGPGDTGNV